ncbi:CYTH domain-containing protein [Candidatus Woesearchaeota archaeon]|nr:CYTH domain-containing protein [Candidatus Woesearchaeota archaeon]
MIEVEQKFSLGERVKQSLLKGAKFISEKTFTDCYYDTADYALTRKDIWLRSREGSFELKVGANQDRGNSVMSYIELTDEQSIRGFLKIPQTGSLEEYLQQHGYVPFCTAITTRRKYQKGKFMIDLDIVDFRDFQYSICEIELMVENQSQIQKAKEEIVAFARLHQIPVREVRGKVVEYLLRMRQDHYRALVEAGVVSEF